jgi:hypothetical protein
MGSSNNLFYIQRNANNTSLTFSYSPYNPEEGDTQKIANLEGINNELLADFRSQSDYHDYNE